MRHWALAALLALAPAGLRAQGNEGAGQICWALATTATPTAEIAQRITAERCQRGDALMVFGLTQEALPIAAAFCDLGRPISLEQADGTRSFLCTYAGQRRQGRNGQERPRAR